jgi:predicted alpha/beta superfamily hydrolase
LTVKDLLDYINKNKISDDTKLGFVKIPDKYFEDNFKVVYMQDGVKIEQCVPSDGIYHQNNFLVLSIT